MGAPNPVSYTHLDVYKRQLPKGVSVLTVHIVTEGNMNLAYLDFAPKK